MPVVLCSSLSLSLLLDLEEVLSAKLISNILVFGEVDRQRTMVIHFNDRSNSYDKLSMQSIPS